MSAEGSSLPPDNDHPGSFFARVFGRCDTLFAKHRAPSAPHAPGPSGGETDSHTSAPQHRTATGSLHSASTENETMASPSSTTSAIDPTPARRKSTIPAVSATEPRSSPTGIRPASHFQQRNDMTGSSMTSGSPVSPERLHRSATRPYAASPPSATDVTSSSLTGRVSTSFAFPDTAAVTPKDSVTSANAPDVNPVTPTTPPRLPVIVDYMESPRNSAQSTNTQSSDVDFICTPPGYRLAPQSKGDGSATPNDAQKGK